MKKYSMLDIYLEKHRIIWLASTDRAFLRQAAEDLTSTDVIARTFADDPYKVSFTKIGHPINEYVVAEYCCDRGWQPIQYAGEGHMAFRREQEEEDNDKQSTGDNDGEYKSRRTLLSDSDWREATGRR